MTEIYSGRQWLADARTGGTANALDGKGMNPAQPIAENHLCAVFLDSGGNKYKRFDYICRSSGATPDGKDIIQPHADALTNAGDANLRWHSAGSNGVGLVESFTPPLLTLQDGKTDLKIRTFQLATGEIFTLLRISISDRDCVTDADLKVKVAQSTNGGSSWTTLAETSTIQTANPIAESSAGAMIAYMVSNNTGAALDIAVTVIGGIQ